MRHFNRYLLKGRETSLGKYFLGAAMGGLCIFLISVGGILLVSLVYGNRGWTTYETIEIILLGIVVSILAVVGTLWQFFLVSKFREILYQVLNRKKK